MSSSSFFNVTCVRHSSSVPHALLVYPVLADSTSTPSEEKDDKLGSRNQGELQAARREASSSGHALGKDHRRALDELTELLSQDDARLLVDLLKLAVAGEWLKRFDVALVV